MMKKMITATAAVLALSACGSDAPDVEDVATPTYDHVEYATMNTVWDMQTGEEQHIMCGMWAQTPGIMVSELSDVVTEATVRSFFADKCE